MDLPGSFAPTHGSPFGWYAPVAVAAILMTWPKLRDRGRRAAMAALWVASLVSAFNYVDLGRFRYGTYLNEWDVYHYYLGTKYADEVGYYGLYEATLVADSEGARRYANPQGVIRDLRTIEFVTAANVLARADAIRARFSTSRWRDFRREVDFFSRSLPPDRFSMLLTDRGYNGTPYFTAFVRTFLSGRFDIMDASGRAVLLGVDVALLALVIVAIGGTFGARAALVTAVFVGTHYLLSWGHLKGALVRTDFACLTALSVCAMRSERPAWAGALLTSAACSRVFPALFALGPLAVLLGEYARNRRWDPSMVRFFGGMFATLAGLTAFAALMLGHTTPWLEWIQKILHHANDPSSWNIGYAVILDAEHVHGVPTYRHLATALADDPALRLERALSLGAVLIAVLLPTLAFASRLPRDRALAIGYVFVFFLMPNSYYYALILVPLLLFFLRESESVASNFGAALLLLGGSFGYLIFSGYEPLAEHPMLRGHRQLFPTYYYASWTLLAACIAAVMVAGQYALRKEREVASPVPSDGS